ncbi:MAG: M48 family metallopeptidase [Dysgonamonadaceae bacterium]|jgi:STE24 endopeptidase|nr:M48 family metallopeptidase [Dysgonamonadaceae bacterium]
MYNTYFYIIIVIYVAAFVWGQILAYLNRKRMSPLIPKELEGIYNAEEYARQQEYQRTNSRFGLISGGFSFIVTLAALVFGLFGWLDEFLRSYTENFLLLPLLFFGIIFIISEIIDLPFEWYAIFNIEERFGFNKSTPRIFWTDFFKGIMLSVLIGGLIITAILYIYHYTEQWFWLLAWVVVTAFSLVMTFFYSEWIVPLFNKQKPLEEGELRTAIEAFAAKAGFQLKNIYVIDGSKRSTKANAYFTGFGRKKRIVLYDTLMDELDTHEIVAVLAHETGHYKRRHVILSMIISILATGITFFILSLFLGNQQLAEALGGRTASFHLGIIGFSMLFAPVSEITGLGMNILSRRNEYQADAFAAAYELGKPLISALKKISVKALSNLNPHPLVVFWLYSHPTLLQRIRAIEKE